MLQCHSDNPERRMTVSDQNEIDDILNELKNKKMGGASAPGNDKKSDDFFYSFTSPKKEDKPVTEESQIFNIGFDAPKKEQEAKHLDNNFDIISDSFKKSNPENDMQDKIRTDMPDGKKPKKNQNKKKKAIIITVAVILVVAIIAAVAVAVASSRNKEEETTTKPTTTEAATEAPVLVYNPLTGESSYNESAVDKRPVACVVENAYAARPQWGIDDSTASPDIILEGEVEGGETRMLWFYADYTALPDQIGPIRSARPPYIKFSELFDAIFIHWGQSQSRDNYVGADSVFASDDVDHINQMAYSDSVGLFGRDSSRGVSSEHTGVLYGDALEAAINEAGFRTDVEEGSFTKLNFNEKAAAVGTESCTSFSLTFSKNTKTRDWTYSEEDKMYHCSDYLTDVARTNLLVLYDQTEYIAKSNYKGSGQSEIYCDYKLSGGSGKLVSLGTITDIKWSVNNGTLSITNADGSDVKLNPGKTWIGYASSNNGGSDSNNTSAQ